MIEEDENKSNEFFTAQYKVPFVKPQLLLGSPRRYLTLACLLDTITPRILKVSLTFNFKSWLPPKELCSYSELRRIPVFSYTSGNRFAARKPLQSMVAGGMLVGSLFGAGIASSVLSGITADIAEIRYLLEHQTFANNTLSYILLLLVNRAYMGI